MPGKRPLQTKLTAAAQTANAPASVRWMADEIDRADSRLLTPEGLARIDAYAGQASDLHELLPSVLPLKRAVWYETSITAQGGTEILMGYLATPTSEGIEIGFVSLAPALEKLIGPLGPVVVTPTEMRQPPKMGEVEFRELRSAAGIIIRALLLSL